MDQFLSLLGLRVAAAAAVGLLAEAEAGVAAGGLEVPEIVEGEDPDDPEVEDHKDPEVEGRVCKGLGDPAYEGARAVGKDQDSASCGEDKVVTLEALDTWDRSLEKAAGLEDR